MNIEFGCGGKLQYNNYVGCDVRAFPCVKYVCQAWDIVNYVDENTVDNIHSRHFFEHLTFVQAKKTLSAWKHILKKGGKLSIIVPDMSFHIKQWLNLSRKTTINTNGMSDEEWSIAGFWGWQRETEKEEIWDIHKSGYDEKLLYDILENFQFNNIERVEHGPMHLWMTCLK